MRNIKLIWDFYGEDSAKTAEHHEKHLLEFINIRQLGAKLTAWESVNPLHATASMVVGENDMISVRDALRPHRAEVYLES